MVISSYPLLCQSYVHGMVISSYPYLCQLSVHCTRLFPVNPFCANHLYIMHGYSRYPVCTNHLYTVHGYFQLPLFVPIIYTLSMVLLFVLPVVSRPGTMGLGMLLVLVTATPVYIIAVKWKQKPRGVMRFYCKCDQINSFWILKGTFSPSFFSQG